MNDPVSKPTRRGPENDLWRVDVDGYPCSVKGEDAKDHLEEVNRKLARMKMALHRISRLHPISATDSGAGVLAREGLS